MPSWLVTLVALTHTEMTAVNTIKRCYDTCLHIKTDGNHLTVFASFRPLSAAPYQTADVLSITKDHFQVNTVHIVFSG